VHAWRDHHAACMPHERCVDGTRLAISLREMRIRDDLVTCPRCLAILARPAAGNPSIELGAD